jgi:hypothetical protein
MDAAGMRWVPGSAEARRRRRCIEVNGAGGRFCARAWRAIARDLHTRDPVQIRTGQPIPLDLAA